MHNTYSLTLVGCLPVVQWRVQKVDQIELAFMQKEVGGYVEQIHIFPDLEQKSIAAFANEEGKLTNLPPVLNIINSSGQVLDTIVGNVLFLKEKGEELEGLSADEVKDIVEKSGLDDIGYVTLSEGCSKDFGSWFPKGKRIIIAELLGSNAGKIFIKRRRHADARNRKRENCKKIYRNDR